MKYKEYLSFSSEITQLEDLLRDIPDGRFVEKLGFESRLEEARKAIDGIDPPQKFKKEICKIQQKENK